MFPSYHLAPFALISRVVNNLDSSLGGITLFSRFRHSRWICSPLVFRFHLPESLRSRPITVLRRYYELSDSCPSGSSVLLRDMNSDSLSGQVSPIHAHSLPDHCSLHTLDRPSKSFSHATPQRFEFLFRGYGFTIGWQARRSTPPNRVRHPTDWSFPFRCFPPRLTATQFRSGTGRRAFTWSGLSPF
jgi:hypothetical protein